MKKLSLLRILVGLNRTSLIQLSLPGYRGESMDSVEYIDEHRRP